MNKGADIDLILMKHPSKKNERILQTQKLKSK